MKRSSNNSNWKLNFDEVTKTKSIPTHTEGMKKYYKAFLALAANFHVAYEDWDQGMVCHSHQDTAEKATAFMT